MTTKTNKEELREEFLTFLHQVVQHTPLKLEETNGTDYDKGYVFYQDMVLRDVEELETTMWEWVLKAIQHGYERGVEEKHRAVEREAYIWFDSWYAYYINNSLIGEDDFGKWASKRLQLLGAEAPTITSDKK